MAYPITKRLWLRPQDVWKQTQALEGKNNHWMEF